VALVIGAIATTAAITVVFTLDTDVGAENCSAADEGIGTVRVLFALAYIVAST
jgi:hypothetical protein